MNYSLFVASLFFFGLTGCQPSNKPSDLQTAPAGATSTLDLAQARRGFTTVIKVFGPAPQEYQIEKPPTGVKEVNYSSGNLKLKAWLSDMASDGKKRPAVVFLHGGFAFGREDWEDAEPFVQAGFVLFMPMLRAENGNPGNHESFYGEVDDAIAAGRYVATLPNVDASKIFVTGHSVGGVLTCLVSMLPSPYHAAAALDGSVDMPTWMLGAPPMVIPYDRKNKREVELRDPLAFAASIKLPLKLYASRDGHAANVLLANKAKQVGKECELVIVPGDHQTMVKPAVQKAIAWFRELGEK